MDQLDVILVLVIMIILMTSYDHYKRYHKKDDEDYQPIYDTISGAVSNPTYYGESFSSDFDV